MSSMTSTMTGRRRSPRPRAIGFLAAALVVVFATYVAAAMRQAPGSRVTDDPDQPAPGSIAQIDQSIKVWTANLTAEPKDFISATTLATLYNARGRLSGDLADQERALDAARTAIRIAPTEPGARATEAAILYTLHDFVGALAAADALYDDDATQLGALATMADSKLELGRIGEARADLEKLASLAPGSSVDVRRARLAFVTGQLDEALRLARFARTTAQADVASGAGADLGFYEYAVGEYARLAGDVASARTGYETALDVRPTDLGALVGLARIDAFEGDTAAAIAGLRKAAAIAPQPETVALLGDLLAASGDAAGAKEQFATVRFIERIGEVQSTVFDRVLLRFELDHDGATEAVLAAARASLAARPDTTGHDVVAWTLYRLGRYDEASAEIGLAAADGAVDARLTVHAGAIALALGDAATGRTSLERALALGPALDPNERAEAARLLGQ